MAYAMILCWDFDCLNGVNWCDNNRSTQVIPNKWGYAMGKNGDTPNFWHYMHKMPALRKFNAEITALLYLQSPNIEKLKRCYAFS